MSTAQTPVQEVFASVQEQIQALTQKYLLLSATDPAGALKVLDELKSIQKSNVQKLEEVAASNRVKHEKAIQNIFAEAYKLADEYARSNGVIGFSVHTNVGYVPAPGSGEDINGPKFAWSKTSEKKTRKAAGGPKKSRQGSVWKGEKKIGQFESMTEACEKLKLSLTTASKKGTSYKLPAEKVLTKNGYTWKPEEVTAAN